MLVIGFIGYGSISESGGFTTVELPPEEPSPGQLSVVVCDTVTGRQGISAWSRSIFSALTDKGLQFGSGPIVLPCQRDERLIIAA